jgi:PEP-CTERM motif
MNRPEDCFRSTWKVTTMRKTWIVLAALVLTPALAAAVPIPFVVRALENSTSGTGVGFDTGLLLNLGDVFSVEVDPNDLWSAGALPRWSNANGLTGPDLIATGADDSGEPIGTVIGSDIFGLHNQHGLSLPFGTLVGSIGGQFFAIGTSFLGPAPASGNLLLYYWDSNNSDNAEFVTAHVDTAVPEPGTLLLVGSGLVGLARARRRRG